MASVVGGVVQFLSTTSGVVASANLTFDAVTTAAGTAVRFGSSALSGNSGLQATAAATLRASSSLSAGAICVSDGSYAIRRGAAVISADMTASASPTCTYRSLTSAPAAELVVSSSARSTLRAAASMSADVTIAPVSATGVVSATSTLSAQSGVTATGAPIYRLVLPTERLSFTDDYFFGRFRVDAGVSMLITGSTVKLQTYPSQGELAAADSYFLGGYRHQVTQDIRDVVVGAGYSGLIEEA